MHESTDTLWRYMKLSTFLLLLEGKAWLPSVATLRSGDPLEGALDDDLHERLWNRFELREGPKRAIEWLSRNGGWEDEHPFANPGPIHARVYGKFLADDIAALRGAWCWFKSELESAGMWSVYGHQGIAVMTDRDRLRKALPKGKEFNIANIEYVDRRPSAEMNIRNILLGDPDLILQPYFFKAIEYQHEKEVRVVAHCPEGAKGVMITNIDPIELIREVVISPLLPEDEAEAIEKVIRLRPDAGRFSIRKSNLVVRSAASGIIRRINENSHGNRDDQIDLAALPNSLRRL